MQTQFHCKFFKIAINSQKKTCLVLLWFSLLHIYIHLIHMFDASIICLQSRKTNKEKTHE